MKKYLILFAFTAILYSCEKDTLTSKEYEYQPDGLYFSGYLNNEYFYVNDSVPNTITISTTTYYYWRPDSFLINFKCIYPLDDNRRLVLRYCLIGNIIELDTITNNYNDFENMISEGSYEYLFAGTTPSSGFDILLLEGDSINYSAANEDWDFDTAFVFNISEMMYNGNINNKNYSGQEIIFTGNLKCNMRYNLNHEEILTINNATIKAKFSQGHYN